MFLGASNLSGVRELRCLPHVVVPPLPVATPPPVSAAWLPVANTAPRNLEGVIYTHAYSTHSSSIIVVDACAESGSSSNRMKTGQGHLDIYVAEKHPPVDNICDWSKLVSHGAVRSSEPLV